MSAPEFLDFVALENYNPLQTRSPFCVVAGRFGALSGTRAGEISAVKTLEIANMRNVIISIFIAACLHCAAAATTPNPLGEMMRLIF